jgi:AraC-like DNA-binding protein
MMFDDYVGQVKMVKGVAGRKCLDKVIYYLQENCNKSCKLTDVARALGYTPQHISSCISNNMKVSYCSLLNGMRIDKSKNLLVDTELSVLEVSYECGFNDLRSFQRNFKKAVGITPTEYRTVNKMGKKDIINSYRSPSIYMTSWEVY